jgi:hypothetical protein
MKKISIWGVFKFYQQKVTGDGFLIFEWTLTTFNKETKQ